MRPTQVWSNVYVNNVTKADTPSFIEECLALAPSPPWTAHSIEADDACSLARGTLEQAARAALQAMLNNNISSPQAGKRKRKDEDFLEQASDSISG